MSMSLLHRTSSGLLYCYASWLSMISLWIPSSPLPDPETCPAGRTPTSLTFAVLILTGSIISYLPQHLRIIRNGTSEGFSPWFLLLGSTAGSSSIFNALILQYPIIRCCTVVSAGRCVTYLIPFVQITALWAMFTGIFVLFMIYYPRHLKYERVIPLPSSPRSHYSTILDDVIATDPDPGESGVVEARVNGVATKIKTTLTTTAEWRTAVVCSLIVAAHFLLFLFLSVVFLLYLPPSPPHPSDPPGGGLILHPLLRYLATFLGVSSAFLTACEFAPQMIKTYRAKLVGALSIVTMSIQVPGTAVLMLNLFLSPGVEWSTWLVYLVGIIMQGTLLTMCILWKARQKRLGVNDFGVPLDTPASSAIANENAPLLASSSS